MLNLIRSLFSSISARSPLRRKLAARYIRGKGIEIGALHNPLWAPPRAEVTFVDRYDVAGLRGHYPELRELPLVNVDVIDDGEKLATFQANSQDFIIANHFIEHAQDPIGTIRRHLEVLRLGGVLYMAVPDKRFTFDRARPETEFAHLLRDYVEGPNWSHEGHLREFASLVQGASGEGLEATIDWLRSTDYSIHFHVWTKSSFHDFLDRLIAELRLPMRIEAFVSNTAVFGENICVLRKVA